MSPEPRKEVGVQNKRELPAGLPQAARSGLESYANSLRKLFGENLNSIVLYGSAARDDYVAGSSDLNVLVVLQDAHIKQVRKAANISRRARDKHSIEPRFMSLETLRTASDVLPIAFLDMQEQYSVLYGEDALQEVVVERRNLRFQCEYQLRFILLRMRNLFLFSSHDRNLMASRLSRSFTTFLHLLKSVYRLLEEEPPVRREEIVARSAERFGLDRELMDQLLDLKLKRRRFSREEVESLFEGYLDLLYDVIGVVDKMAVD
jgi:predicted nucleotidyltransferase